MVALSVGRQASTTDTHHLSVLVMGKSQVLNTEQPWVQKPLFKMASSGAAQVPEFASLRATIPRCQRLPGAPNPVRKISAGTAEVLPPTITPLLRRTSERASW